MADARAGALKTPSTSALPPRRASPRAGGIAGSAGVSNAALDWLADRVVLFRFRNLVFVTFGLFAGAGAFVSLGLLAGILVGQGLAPGLTLALAAAGCVAVVLGSWLLAQALDLRMLLRDPLPTLRRPVFVSWGGILAMPLSLVCLARALDLDALLLLDALALSLPLGHAVGRLGCLSYGCCFGRPKRRGLAIRYRHPSAKAARVAGLRDVPLHPAALYEAVLDLGILLAVVLAAACGAPLGVPTGLAMLSYGLSRFSIEFWRENGGRVVGGLRRNQWIALLLAALGAAVLRSARIAGRAAPPLEAQAVIDAAPWLLPGIALCALLVALSFSLHRGRVGSW